MAALAPPLRFARREAQCARRRWYAGRTARSGNQQHLALGLALFEVAMPRGGLRQRELAVDAHLELILGDPGEDVGGTPEQLVARGDVMGDGRPREEERAFGVQHLRIHRSTPPALLP